MTGVVHPDQIVTNRDAKAGADLVLTKPLGTGIVATAIKKEKAPDALVERAVKVMATLNRGACDAMMEVGVDACTDITVLGFWGTFME